MAPVLTNWLAVFVYGLTIVHLIRLVRLNRVHVWGAALCVVLAIVCVIWGLTMDMRSFIPPLCGCVAMFVLITCGVIFIQRNGMGSDK
jgi:hypothetical protein